MHKIQIILKQKFIIGLIFISLFGLCRADDSCADNPIALKAPHLKKGDKILVIAPAYLVGEHELNKSISNLKEFGLNVTYPENVLNRHGYLAGTDKDRAAQINRGFADEEIKAIIAIRGGYGTGRMLPYIDYDKIKANPKIVMGYSDITALQLALYQKTGLITFYGPLAKLEWPSYTEKNVRDLLIDGGQGTIFTSELKKVTRNNGRTAKIDFKTINGGEAKGVILGGNFATLDSLFGIEEYFPSDWRGKILFLEDIGEPSRKIDRMLLKLKLSGVLDVISGFIFGTCIGCDNTMVDGSGFTVDEVLTDYIEPLGIPAFSGAPIGHHLEMLVIPIGAQVKMDADKGTIEILENVVDINQ